MVCAAVKARPIIFNGDMVRALLDGRKTQTRRVVKPQPDRPLVRNAAGDWRGADREGIDPRSPTWPCPYGQPGDLLWVRETWQEFFEDEMPPGRGLNMRGRMGSPAQPGRSVIAYRADGEMPPHPEYGAACWRPSIHMPRWASRLTLRITEVRVQRLQEISEDDARTEGVHLTAIAPGDLYRNLPCAHCGQREQQHVGMARACWGGRGTCFSKLTLRGGFAYLWGSIHGDGAWASNPWVWAITFEVIRENVDQVLARAAS